MRRAGAAALTVAGLVLPAAAGAQSDTAPAPPAGAAAQSNTPAPPPGAVAQAPSPTRFLTREIPPFAYRDDGQWRGIAVELWNQVAADLEVSGDYAPVELRTMLSSLADGTATVAVSALSVTAEREQSFDFSHPYFRAGLGVAVADTRIDGWQRFWRAVTSPTFLGAISALLMLLATTGALVWRAERRHNSQFPHDAVQGIGAGVWWSGVTMTTVGYGDKAPVTFGGRLIAMIWMFTSLIIISTVTASLTTSFTLDALSEEIDSESALAGVRTATVDGSTSELRLNARGIRPRLYAEIEDALRALARGEVEAVVYDRPMLRHLVARDHVGRLRVLPLEFAPQDYAFAFPAGSPLREQVNRRLLVHARGIEWDRLLARYLGGGG